MIRKAVYAGSWYPTDEKEIKSYLEFVKTKEQVLACVCPHAGWMYSGKTAGKVYGRLNPYEIYVIVGPNHTGYGEDVSIFPEGKWETPLGEIEVDNAFVEEVVRNSEFIKKDYKAHMREHAIEVQLPFLQITSQNFKIVPIIIKHADLQVCKDIARAICLTIKSQNKKTLLIASTDMTHFEPHNYAKKQDEFAIDEILKLNPEGLFKIIHQRGISMCGYLPTTVILYAANILQARNAELIEYKTSGDVTGDYESVVGYAGIIIK